MSSPHNQPDSDEPLRPHVYDGIQEYDNRLPNWWLWTFYGAVIFSVLYWFSFYDAEIVPSDAERMEMAMAKVEEARLAAIGEVNNETLWQMARNPGFIEAGKTIFADKCVACHGENLDGGIGLNLVDSEWKWGNEPMSVFAIVKNGSPDKTAGMQSWISELGPQKVSQVVAYVLSYHSPEELARHTTLNPPLGL